MKQEQARRRREKLRRGEQTVSLYTQNVRGFSEHEGKRTAWLQAFRARQEGQRVDVVFAQETHINKAEIDGMVTRHCLH